MANENSTFLTISVSPRGTVVTSLLEVWEKREESMFSKQENFIKNLLNRFSSVFCLEFKRAITN